MNASNPSLPSSVGADGSTNGTAEQDFTGHDTICAVATAPGGAIGIVRISGLRAIEFANRIFSADLSHAQGYSVHYGRLRDLDDALATVFRAPHSYTGEDSVEFSCHGSSFILEQVCRLLCREGCRMANPGEFTQRAFLNGKMDLAQAEAVADLIATRTNAQHRMAISQLRGTFSRHIDTLYERLLRLTSLMELELDFADHEDLEFADRTEVVSLTDETICAVTSLADSFATGNAIKDGVRVAIVGPTNAGKSTLLNTILHEERAIVSNIHGTTRDTIEDTFIWQGITFRFIDTAGLRNTDDEVERIGIARTHQAIQDAHIVLYLLDASNASAAMVQLQPLIAECTHPHLVVYTKADTIDSQSDIPTEHTDAAPSLLISAITGQGMAELQQWVCTTARTVLHIDTTEMVVTNQRHYDALCSARDALLRVRTSLMQNIPTDLITQDLRQSLHHLATITHREITSDTVLQNIFRHFCIGK